MSGEAPFPEESSPGGGAPVGFGAENGAKSVPGKECGAPMEPRPDSGASADSGPVSQAPMEPGPEGGAKSVPVPESGAAASSSPVSGPAARPGPGSGEPADHVPSRGAPVESEPESGGQAGFGDVSGGAPDPGLDGSRPAGPGPACEPETERYPFWGYADVCLFAGLVIPSMLLGLGLVKAVFSVLRIHSSLRVVELLPEQLLGYLLLFGALAMTLRLHYGRPFWRSLAWLPMNVPPLWVVAAGVGTSLSVALLGSLIHTPTTSNPITELLENRVSAILMAIFGTTVAPVCEELAFRGFLQPLLVRSVGATGGILLAAIPFGLLHYGEFGNSWRHAVLISLAGATFGWMRQRTGSTKASALMHAAYNGLIFAVVFSQKDMAK